MARNWRFLSWHEMAWRQRVFTVVACTGVLAVGVGVSFGGVVLIRHLHKAPVGVVPTQVPKGTIYPPVLMSSPPPSVRFISPQQAVSQIPAPIYTHSVSRVPAPVTVIPVHTHSVTSIPVQAPIASESTHPVPSVSTVTAPASVSPEPQTVSPVPSPAVPVSP